jgi:predicted MPP superfamily phosphohydrolase
MLTILCLILALFSLWYVPYRLKKTLSSKRIAVIYAIVSILFIFGFIALIVSRLYLAPSLLSAVLYCVLGVFLAYHIYFFLLLLVAHPVSKFFPAKAGKAVTIAAATISALLIAWGLWNSYSLQVTEQTVKVKGLKAPITIMHAPDLHLGPARGEAFLRKVIDAIKKSDPDIVLYNGDMVDGNIALKPEIFEEFRGLPMPQFFTTGNHDFYVDTNTELDFIKKAGIRILRSETAELLGINLIGLEYMNADRASSDSHRVNDLFMDEELPKAKWNPDLPRILAHHSPVGMQYAIKEKIPVMLTGHTHGGQFFPGTLLIRLRFPKYKGRYDYEGLTLLVSQGAGTFGPPIRLGTISEIQLVRLEPADQ